ncbi:MAG: dephospho-CoA kinase [Clostridia bacterium]
MKKLIAITGGIGSGKTTVSAYIKSKGYNVYDCDEIARKISDNEEIIDKIKDTFGSQFVYNGKIMRKELAEYCFKDENLTQKLNAIYHKAIFENLKLLIEADKNDTVFAEVPLLYETKTQKNFDEVWLVCADKEKQIERALIRSGYSYENVMNRIARQLPTEYKKTLADKIIENNGEIQGLYHQIDVLLLQKK